MGFQPWWIVCFVQVLFVHRNQSPLNTKISTTLMWLIKQLKLNSQERKKMLKHERGRSKTIKYQSLKFEE